MEAPIRPSGKFPDGRALLRFGKYVLVGGSTFLLDLLLLFVLTQKGGLDPVTAAALSFFLAISINYILSRRYVFRGTMRSVGKGYVGFVSIAGSGLLLVTGGMHLLVGLLGWHYLLARILIALLTGVWNYLLNLYVNFQVAGKH